MQPKCFLWSNGMSLALQADDWVRIPPIVRLKQLIVNKRIERKKLEIDLMVIENQVQILNVLYYYF